MAENVDQVGVREDIAQGRPSPPDEHRHDRFRGMDLGSSFGWMCTKHNVVGAQLGILDLSSSDGSASTSETSFGLLNRSTGAAVVDNSIFQLGSITKVWTTALIMQLIDEGRLDLDTPVQHVLPDFSLEDKTAAGLVTIRHLLSHTSGIDGDVFTDMGRGDEAVERYVANLATTHILHPPGRGFSYSNAGFVVAGRIVEVLREMSWDEALRKFLTEPLGLTHVVTLPEEALLHSTAVGHYLDANGSQHRVNVWGITRALGPAGLITSRSSDALAFAAAFLRGGVGLNGARILSTSSVANMCSRHVDLKSQGDTVTQWGLGWFLEDWHGTTVIGHDGVTIGQRAFLRIFPESGLALILLTTGGEADGLFHELLSHLADDIGALVPAAIQPVPGYLDPDLQSYVGTYSDGGKDIVIEANGEELLAVVTPRIVLGVGKDEAEVFTLLPVHAGVFALRGTGNANWSPVRFFQVHGTKYLTLWNRSIPKSK
ncbi:serine hydrolase [Arthrobacter sp. MYb23]|uniref:serine hydrolase domain-containing protein n=1 Tax=unclassified Arthrobacter TaxID=235627 RepID=UPI000CFDF1D5|nr:MULTISPECIES: serine hydrolase domain-containing protein [unclassified Arthrobacter]PRB36387.1 serine hydrolase [Arthrobacter sp. MYb51]PRB94252.1 serine hydrolase [Arthrobacter sp. MYb23]